MDFLNVSPKFVQQNVRAKNERNNTFLSMIQNIKNFFPTTCRQSAVPLLKGLSRHDDYEQNDEDT